MEVRDLFPAAAASKNRDSHDNHQDHHQSPPPAEVRRLVAGFCGDTWRGHSYQRPPSRAARVFAAGVKNSNHLFSRKKGGGSGVQCRAMYTRVLRTLKKAQYVPREIVATALGLAGRTLAGHSFGDLDSGRPRRRSCCGPGPKQGLVVTIIKPE